MSGGVILQESLRIVGKLELPDEAESDVAATLDFGKTGPLQFFYDAAHEAGLDRTSILQRGAGVYFNYCAGQLADDLMDGECTYLKDPVRTAPATQFLLQNLFYATLAGAGLPGSVIEAAALDLVLGCGPQHVEVRTCAWTPEASMAVAEGLGGRQFSAYLRLLWAQTPLAGEAPRVGRALGVAAHVARDIATNDPRHTTLSPREQRETVRWAMASALVAEEYDLRCVRAALGAIMPLLRGAP